MDVRMPRVDGIAATSALRRDLGADGPAVLVLTTFDIEEAALSAIEAGADGFVLKDAETEFLLAAIRAVHTGSQVVSASATRRLFAQHRTRDRPGPEYDILTDRERDVLIEVAHGKSNTEISRDLFITEATVKTHVSKLLGKLATCATASSSPSTSTARTCSEPRPADVAVGRVVIDFGRPICLPTAASQERSPLREWCRRREPRLCAGRVRGRRQQFLLRGSRDRPVSG